ncbi:MAG: hypothetical protein DI597_08325 [Pseudoxanthomonas spadix]|nr:MAG: hypothetical protein DI597_08325 [Pseudoxanthomonas spadix]
MDPRIDAKTALIIVDIFNPFDFPGAQALWRRTLDIAPNLRALIAAFVRAEAPIVYANDDICHGCATVEALIGAARRRSPWSDTLVTRLAPLPPGQVVLKDAHSGFRRTALSERLRGQGIERVVVSGIATDLCVLATAIDASAEDYDVWIPADAAQAEDDAKHARAIRILEASFKLSTDPWCADAGDDAPGQT